MLAFKPRQQLQENKTPSIGTHNGSFHCDEILACFMLRQLPEYQNATILRSRDEMELRKKCDIVVDVGGEYDYNHKYFDHHQKSFNETFSSLRPELGTKFQIRLSSAGLIYAHYGERVIEEILKKHKINLSPCNLRLCYIEIYRIFLSEIDAIDNGIPMYEYGCDPLYKISTNISARVNKLNPTWIEEDITNVDRDQRFEKAMTIVGQEFIDNVIAVGDLWIKAREYVREALQQACSVYITGEILHLPRFCPWKVHLADLEYEYKMEGVPKLVIFKDNTTWRVAGVPLTPDSFLGRKFLPQPWRGLRNEELSQLAGIPDLIFVHHTGFIGGAKTKEAAVEMAIKSVQW